MAYVDWRIEGPKVGACSCNYGCPCEFNAPPTRGHCEGLEAHFIEKGHFGDVRLDGLVVGARYRWPGPVHEGKGVVQGFIDESATEAQRQALFQILGGKEQEPTTVFNIYGSTVAREIDPVFAKMEFACDFEKRTARFVVPGVVEMTAEPIRNPVTGAAYFARIVLPTGFEFRTAEMASADFTAAGNELAMAHTKSYGSLWYAAYGPYGLIEGVVQPASNYQTGGDGL
ncbi:MAG: DUF1326 domain-containing protein [Hyphomicrobiaceae bacterium]